MRLSDARTSKDQFKRDFESAFCGARDPALARALNPQPHSFRAWLMEHAREIPLD